MHDNWLVLISLSVSGLGVVGLMFTLLLLEPSPTSIATVPSLGENAPVLVKGEVLHVEKRGNITLVKISELVETTVVVFDEMKESNASCIIVRGKTSSYLGTSQIVASRISSC